MNIPCKIDPAGTLVIPGGYTRVNYLQGNGDQWIDTGIKPLDFDYLEIDFQMSKPAQYGGKIFGVDNNVASNNLDKAIIAYHGASSDVGLWYGFGPRGNEKNTRNETTRRKYIINNGTECFLSDIPSVKVYSSLNNVLNVNLYLFRANGAAFNGEHADRGVRIFGMMAKKDGNIISNIVPILDEKGRPAMYDIHTRQLHYNQGTGEFLYA